MSLKSIIKNTLIKISVFFLNSRKSRCIFYHDIHSEVRFTDMSSSVELFKDHVQTICRVDRLKIICIGLN